MPVRNIVKPYVAGGYYHLYNRGVNQENIFRTPEDYATFLRFLEEYLTPTDVEALQKKLSAPALTALERLALSHTLSRKNLHNRITLECFCLMPNHFHLLLRQEGERDIKEFMQSFMTRYTGYFNKAHGRVGSPFQGTYRAALLQTDEQRLFLSRYIHRNPLGLLGEGDTRNWGEMIRSQPSSYTDYLGETKRSWVQPQDILTLFASSGVDSYVEFIEWNRPDLNETMVKVLGSTALDA